MIPGAPIAYWNPCYDANITGCEELGEVSKPATRNTCTQNKLEGMTLY